MENNTKEQILSLLELQKQEPITFICTCGSPLFNETNILKVNPNKSIIAVKTFICSKCNKIPRAFADSFDDNINFNDVVNENINMTEKEFMKEQLKLNMFNIDPIKD